LILKDFSDLNFFKFVSKAFYISGPWYLINSIQSVVYCQAPFKQQKSSNNAV